MVHVREEHLRKIKCKSCEETFDKNSDLEMHMKTIHVSSESFNCGTCEKKFVLKWRLTKHQENHTVGTLIKKMSLF